APAPFPILAPTPIPIALLPPQKHKKTIILFYSIVYSLLVLPDHIVIFDIKYSRIGQQYSFLRRRLGSNIHWSTTKQYSRFSLITSGVDEPKHLFLRQLALKFSHKPFPPTPT